MTYHILDVGCGTYPTGDVNLDLYIQKTEQRQYGSDINPKKVRNFILADALHLPFKSNSFDEVVSYRLMHQIETENPILFLREAIRVAKYKVTIVTNHAFARSKLSLRPERMQKHFWRGRWFHQVLKNFYHEVTVITRPLPFNSLSFSNWPSKLKIVIYLKGPENSLC